MSYIVVDMEADGPIPAEYSMVCFGAVIFDTLLDNTFSIVSSFETRSVFPAAG